MAKKEFNITTNFHEEPLRSILNNITDRLNYSHIKVSEFPRYGQSGAKLILAYFDGKPVPLLIKVAPREKSERESAAIKTMQEYLGNDCSLRVDDLFEAGEFGALVYQYYGDDRKEKVENPRTLSNVLFTKRDRLGKLSISCIKEILKNLEKAHKQCVTRRVNTRKHYKGYFHKYRSRQCLATVLGDKNAHQEFEYMGANIFNPLIFEQLLPSYVDVLQGPMHGDLHPDNIVLDQHNHPHLIDYEWSVPNRDVLIDYVLLENSVRFKHFPRCANDKERLRMDRLLLKHEVCPRINSSEYSSESLEYFRQLASMVGVIRDHAKSALGAKYCYNSYLLTQFIVLFGVVYVDGYNPFASARTLGMIARKLLNEI